jgi:ribosome-associated protein
LAKLLKLVEKSLEDDKAENVVAIDLKGKSSIADYMIIATGRSSRHVGSIADHLRERLKGKIPGTPAVEGRGACDWVVVDAGDVIVHVFRPDVRRFYNLEKMWLMPPKTALAI